MNSKEIRQSFIKFFEDKEHHHVESAPVLPHGDKSLLFTNAGMNQFKPIFLGSEDPKHLRVVNSQKCIRVSGKHNDLEEVGRDGFHHTFFEMLGNWSFGDYFKKEAIKLAWDLLTEVYKINPDILYVTIFEGDKKDGLNKDNDSYKFWKEIVSEDKIVLGSKKDNFWEMGEIGPCGPCTEIHYDNRDESERSDISGDMLVNKDHPQVIEIWNLVFIQYNRFADKSLIDKLANALLKYPNVAILSDEIYGRLIFEKKEFPTFFNYPDLYERLIVLDGWSKTYSMTGWRLGWGAVSYTHLTLPTKA